MLKSARQILAIFTRAERLRFIGVFLAMLGMGILQMAGVGVILPFVSLLSDPGSIHDNVFLQALYSGLGFQSVNSFLILIGSVLLVVLAASNAVTALTLWLLMHFAGGGGSDACQGGCWPATCASRTKRFSTVTRRKSARTSSSNPSSSPTACSYRP